MPFDVGTQYPKVVDPPPALGADTDHNLTRLTHCLDGLAARTWLSDRGRKFGPEMFASVPVFNLPRVRAHASCFIDSLARPPSQTD